MEQPGIAILSKALSVIRLAGMGQGRLCKSYSGSCVVINITAEGVVLWRMGHTRMINATNDTSVLQGDECTLRL